MKISLALLADYANCTAEGKLNILGVFDRIFAHNFPVIHPQMYLIFTLEYSRAESGKQKKIEIKLCNADGNVLFSVGNDYKVPQLSAGILGHDNQIVCLNSINFAKQGDYVFSILINGDEKSSVSLKVCEVKKK